MGAFPNGHAAARHLRQTPQRGKCDKPVPTPHAHVTQSTLPRPSPSLQLTVPALTLPAHAQYSIAKIEVHGGGSLHRRRSPRRRRPPARPAPLPRVPRQRRPAPSSTLDSSTTPRSASPAPASAATSSSSSSPSPPSALLPITFQQCRLLHSHLSSTTALRARSTPLPRLRLGRRQPSPTPSSPPSSKSSPPKASPSAAFRTPSSSPPAPIPSASSATPSTTPPILAHRHQPHRLARRPRAAVPTCPAPASLESTYNEGAGTHHHRHPARSPAQRRLPRRSKLENLQRTPTVTSSSRQRSPSPPTVTPGDIYKVSTFTSDAPPADHTAQSARRARYEASMRSGRATVSLPEVPSTMHPGDIASG